MTFAQLQPYDHWTQWAVAYLMLDQGKPTYAAATKALGPLMEYDTGALLKVLTYIDATSSQRVAIGRRLCEISANQCGTLGALLLREGEETEAAGAYEQWVARTRDRVALSNGLTWLVRYYLAHRKRDRAEELALMAASTGSSRGLQTLANFLERAGRSVEAEPLYERVADRYDETAPLGVFRLRRALEAHDKKLESEAWELLRPAFPTGPEPLQMHALDVTPVDGAAERRPPD
jgi:tetratricopeptide (TPR) repeat protein